VPERDLRADVDALLTAVNTATRIVFLANPNNPTGTYLPADEMHRLREGLPPGVLLVIDAAYAGYGETEDYSAGFDAGDALPPLLSSGVLMDNEGYAAWEAHVIRTLAGGDGQRLQATPEQSLNLLEVHAHTLRRWRPGATTIVDVKAAVYFRKRPGVVGIAPLTSMFWRGENSNVAAEDFRPEVHDSDGLLLCTGRQSGA